MDPKLTNKEAKKNQLRSMTAPHNVCQKVAKMRGETRRCVRTSLERNTAAQRPGLFWFAHGKTSCHGILYFVWAPRSTVVRRTSEG